MPTAVPFIIEGVSAAAAVAGGVMSYQANRQAADTSQRIADYNAAQDRAKAKQAQIDSAENIRRQRQQDQVYLSRQRSAMAAAGVLDTGSELDLLVTTAGRMEQNNQQRWRDAMLGTENLYAAASVGQAEGAARAQGYRYAATGSLFSTTARLAQIGMQSYNEGLFGPTAS